MKSVFDLSMRRLCACLWAVILCGGGNAVAQPFPLPDDALHGVLLGIPLLALELTSEQEAQIKAIQDQYQSELFNRVDAVHTARQAVRKAVIAESNVESAVRTSSAELAAAEVELAVLRAMVFAQIRPFLTDEQVGTLLEMVGRRRSSMPSLSGIPPSASMERLSKPQSLNGAVAGALRLF